MAVKRIKADINVLEASRRRIKNIFNTGLPIYLSFSGGKDSLCLANVVLEMLNAGEIDPTQLTVQFIDEEAVYDCIDEKVKEWRKKFMLAGAKFEWFCLEVKHFNCFNQLTNDESFICWDHTKEDVWVRRPPKFAIRSHPALNPRKDTYQTFLAKRCANGINMVGIRVAESLQRLQNIARMNGGYVTKDNKTFPIYDWRDHDVWLYLLDHNIDIPVVYLYLWQTGTRKNQLRISQFFSVDTAKCLVNMNEYYPDLMEKVCRREPNAYLASLYWDSEMFGRKSRNRKELEKDDGVDYRAKLLEVFKNPTKYFHTEHALLICNRYLHFYRKDALIFDNKDCKDIYEGLMAGDPKMRTLRALYTRTYTRYVQKAKEGTI